jgi:hypothetical protein
VFGGAAALPARACQLVSWARACGACDSLLAQQTQALRRMNSLKRSQKDKVRQFMTFTGVK